ncbi:hypothetical protein [Rhizobium jaguaris]|uniref:hypothetical protein n=1 Tax=Rhizobium jaguaris TaxID=1312183 RepID=UPI00196954EA|nr:hypothetical protein [Rhizobium jaguaris]
MSGKENQLLLKRAGSACHILEIGNDSLRFKANSVAAAHKREKSRSLDQTLI